MIIEEVILSGISFLNLNQVHIFALQTLRFMDMRYLAPVVMKVADCFMLYYWENRIHDKESFTLMLHKYCENVRPRACVKIVFMPQPPLPKGRRPPLRKILDPPLQCFVTAIRFIRTLTNLLPSILCPTRKHSSRIHTAHFSDSVGGGKVLLTQTPSGQRSHGRNMGPGTETLQKEHGTRQPDRK